MPKSGAPPLALCLVSLMLGALLLPAFLPGVSHFHFPAVFAAPHPLSH